METTLGRPLLPQRARALAKQLEDLGWACLTTVHATRDPGNKRQGWDWPYSAAVHAVRGDHRISAEFRRPALRGARWRLHLASVSQRHPKVDLEYWRTTGSTPTWQGPYRWGALPSIARVASLPGEKVRQWIASRPD